MPPGAHFFLNIQATNEAEANLVLKAFQDAGFKDVRTGFGPAGAGMRENYQVGSGAFFQGTR